MGLVHADNCLYCGGDDWIPYKHWRLCASCSKEFIAGLSNDFPQPHFTRDPMLLGKGRPSTPGPPKRKAA